MVPKHASGPFEYFCFASWHWHETLPVEGAGETTRKERGLLSGSRAGASRASASVGGFSSIQFLWHTWLSPAPGAYMAASRTQWPAAASLQLCVQCLHEHSHEQLSLGPRGHISSKLQKTDFQQVPVAPWQILCFQLPMAALSNNIWISALGGLSQAQGKRLFHSSVISVFFSFF